MKNPKALYGFFRQVRDKLAKEIEAENS